jgi:hypothetical protein
MALKKNPDVRTTDDHFLMEVAVMIYEEELFLFPKHRSCKVKVIEKH